MHILPRWRCTRRRHPLSQAVNRVLQTSSKTLLLDCLPSWSFLYLDTAAACFSVLSVLARFAVIELTKSRNLSSAIPLGGLQASKIFVEIRESQSKQKSAETQSPWRLRLCCGCRHARNQICNRYILKVFKSSKDLIISTLHWRIPIWLIAIAVLKKITQLKLFTEVLYKYELQYWHKVKYDLQFGYAYKTLAPPTILWIARLVLSNLLNNSSHRRFGLMTRMCNDIRPINTVWRGDCKEK